MAKPPKKQATPKSTETTQITVATVDLPKTPEQAMDELTELSQELGLYDVEGNPLLKNVIKDQWFAQQGGDTPTTSQEVTEDTLVSKDGESNTVVAPEAQNASEGSTEGLKGDGELGTLLDKVTEENKHTELIPTVELGNPSVDDKLTLKDGWGKPIPTKLVVIQSMNYTDLVAQMLYAGYLGSQLDCSFRILSTVPFRIRVLMPEDQYKNFLSKESQVVFDENLTYNKVLVKSWDLYGFWKSIINIGKNGGIVQPRQVAQKRPMYMVPILTRAPVKDTPESRLSRVKVVYTKDELEEFSLEDLRIVASWYEGIPSMNAKKGYIKEILIKQGN